MNDFLAATARHVEIAKQIGVYIKDWDRDAYILKWHDKQFSAETYLSEFHAWSALPKLYLLEQIEQRLAEKRLQLETDLSEWAEQIKALPTTQFMEAIKVPPFDLEERLEDYAHQLGQWYYEHSKMQDVQSAAEAIALAEGLLSKQMGQLQYEIFDRQVLETSDTIKVSLHYRYQKDIYSGGTMGMNFGGTFQPIKYERTDTIEDSKTYTFGKSPTYA